MDYVSSIHQDGELFYATALAADPSFGVPCCPGWRIVDLVWHLGEVHWFWATGIEMRATDPGQIELKKPTRPRTYEGVVGWGRSQLDRILKILESTPDDAPVWTWALNASDHTVGFIRRHQVQETAVHRWDIQSAARDSAPDQIDPETASDSIDEFLTISLPWAVNESKPLSGSVHLHATDVTGEWFIERDGTIDRGHATADVAVRGTASDLLLALYERIPVDGLDVIGSVLVARDLVERVDTT